MQIFPIFTPQFGGLYFTAEGAVEKKVFNFSEEIYEHLAGWNTATFLFGKGAVYTLPKCQFPGKQCNEASYIPIIFSGTFIVFLLSRIDMYHLL